MEEDSVYDQQNVVFQGQFLPQYQEKFLKDLLSNIYNVDEEGNVTGIASTSPLASVGAPSVAEFTENQEQAIRLAREGIGAYEPMLREAEASMGTAGGAYDSGIGALSGTTGRFDPSDIQEFMNPFENAAVQQALKDIRQQGEEAAVGIGARGPAAGALGGSREAVQRGMLESDVLEQQGRTAAQMRAAGFESAAKRAQSAFENQARRGQNASQIFGQLGQGIASLAGKQAGLGTLAQSAAQSDVNALYNIGSLEQQQQQRELDVQRQADLEQAYEPFKRFGFMSDIFRGIPSTSSTMTLTGVPSPNPVSSVVGNTIGFQNYSGYS